MARRPGRTTKVEAESEVDPTDGVREAGTGVMDTRSGWRLPDGTLVNHVDGDEDAAGPAVATGATDAVEDAARARIDDAAPAPGGDDDATAGEGGGAGLAVDRVFDGTDFDLAEAIGQTSGDDDTAGLFGRISRDDVVKGKPGEDLLGGGDDSPPEAPFSDRPNNDIDVPDAREAGIFDLLGQAGADGDPLSSFLGAVEARLGRDLGLTTPSDTTDPSAPIGKDSIAAGGNGITVTRGREDTYTGTRDVANALGIEVAPPSSFEINEYIEVKDTNNGTITRINENGSTRTTTLDGKVIDTTPALTAPMTSSPPIPAAKTTEELEAEKKEAEEAAKRKAEEDRKKAEEEKKQEEDKKDDAGGGAKQPDPENETAPLPEEFQKQLDGDVARLRALRNQGPDSGDGATDPSEIESEVIGIAGELESHAAQGRRLFGQPDPLGETGGGGALPNAGADPQGAGVITPGDDQTLAGGARRNDDPFDAAQPSPEPVQESDDSAEVAEFLPPSSEIAGPVDDPAADVPDQILDAP